uniref:CNNM transmembrane domain-containing protein n=1 Tax=Romanomermis culicivorax TaxID=13658 RepID=A0A915HG57_ROMCU
MLIKSADQNGLSNNWVQNDTINSTTTTIFDHAIITPRNISCLLINHGEVLCNGIKYILPEPIIDSSDGTFWMYLAIYIFLVLFAGLMSGLTLAILSLDLTSLKVTLAAGSGKSARYAKRLIPLVKR